VVRHAQATTCSVRLAVEEAEPPRGTAEDSAWSNALRIDICDDGHGLPVDGRRGVGLVSMRERAEELGGTLWLGSGPAGGTRVVARLPLPRREVQVTAGRLGVAAGRLRVLIADGHPLSRAGMRALLETMPDMEVVGVAGTGD